MLNQPAYRPAEGFLPQNIEAEQAVLGSLLIDPRAIERVAPFLRPDDFYLPVNGQIYGGMLALHERDMPTDIVTLSDHLDAQDRLDDVGGRAYLASLANMVPTSINVEYYGRIVERLAVLRRLVDAGNRISAIGYDERLEADNALDQAEKVLFEISRMRVTKDFAPLSRILAEVYEKLDHIHSHESQITGIPTGYIDLDRLTSGFQRSDLIILAARPSQGKTGLALNIAHAVAVRAGLPVGIFSLEMSAEQLAHRLISVQGQIESQKLRSGRMSDSDWDRLVQAVGVLSEAPIFVDDTPALSATEMRSKARRLHTEQGLGLLIVDYLQLMQGASAENRVQEISAISRALKAVARELDVPVLALSQLSRAPEQRPNHEPILSDLRDSGCLAGETLVYLPGEGVHRRIDSLAGLSGFNVLALNTETWRLEPRQVLRAFSTGHRSVHTLRLRIGRSVQATANHRFLTVRGWKRLDQLTPGDRIALPRTLTGPERPTLRDEEMALLGHLIGDGCTLPRHCVQYTTGDVALANTVVDLAIEVFGDAISPRISHERDIRRARDWYQVYLAASSHLSHRIRNPVAAWLSDLGVFGLRSFEKRVPEAVFAQPSSSVARFLRHLWSTDGCIHLRSTMRYSAAIYFATSSARLAEEVQFLLLRLGINARLTQRAQPGKGRDQHHVIVSGKPDIERFLGTIGGLGQAKQLHASAITRRLSQSRANTNRDVLPREVWTALAIPAMHTAGISARQMQADLGTPYCGTSLYKQNLGRDRAARLASAVRSQELAALASSDVYWDEIAEIEPAGEADVYDLTVDEHHNFVANGITVHNSIEQDADIVMFIYRDVMYNPETERPHVADILVAKHRNGPTGRVGLFFQESLMKFFDLRPHSNE